MEPVSSDTDQLGGRQCNAAKRAVCSALLRTDGSPEEEEDDEEDEEDVEDEEDEEDVEDEFLCNKIRAEAAADVDDEEVGEEEGRA